MNCPNCGEESPRQVDKCVNCGLTKEEYILNHIGLSQKNKDVNK